MCARGCYVDPRKSHVPVSFLHGYSQSLESAMFSPVFCSVHEHARAPARPRPIVYSRGHNAAAATPRCTGPPSSRFFFLLFFFFYPSSLPSFLPSWSRHSLIRAISHDIHLLFATVHAHVGVVSKQHTFGGICGVFVRGRSCNESGVSAQISQPRLKMAFERQT